MKILHVYKDYYPVLGGIENHIRDVSEALVQRGHQVTALVCNAGNTDTEVELNGVRVIKVGRLGTFASMPLSLGYANALSKLSADITHVHAPYPLGEVAQFLNRKNRPYVVTYHADVTRPIQRLVMTVYGPLLRHILKNAERILATNPNYVKASPYLRTVTDKIRIVPLSADVHRFTPPPTTNAPRPFTILFVGKMRHYKGVDYLIKAMAHLPADTQLLLSGEGPKRAEWGKLVHDLGLQARVKFLGEVSNADLPALYQAADVFVLPSTTRAEALGIVLIEAMATGLPCISTELGTGTSFLVEDGRSGFVVPPCDAHALATALNKLHADPALRQRMGARGLARVQSELTLEAMTNKVEAVYNEVVGKV